MITQNNFQLDKNIFLYNGVISAGSGSLAVILCNVFDISRVKMLEQKFLNNINFLKKQQFKSAQIPFNMKFDFLKKNTFETFKETLFKEGFQTTFFSGFKKQILFIAIRNGTFFPLFEYFKSKQKNYFKQNQFKLIKETLLAASMTRFLNSFILFPIEILRIKKQLTHQSKNTQNIIQTFSSQKKKFFKMFLRYQFSQLVGTCLFFGTYEQTKFNLKNSQYFKNHSYSRLCLTTSLITTIFTGLFFYPFEIVQIGAVVLDKQLAFTEYYKVLTKNFGSFAILRGFTNYMLRHAISTSITFGIYERYKIQNL